MNNYIRENWFKVVLFIALGLFIGYSYKGNTTEVKRNFTGNDLSSTDQITCTFPRILNVNYLNNEISQNLPLPEKDPIIFTFSNIKNSEIGQLSYLDSTRTITNVPVVKMIENEEKIIYLDGAGENYFSTHTIYKKQGVAVFTKTVSLLGIPSGSLSMGDCVPY